MIYKLIAVALAVLILLTIPVYAQETVEIRGAVLDTYNATTGLEDSITTDFIWNAQNFAGFWYDLDQGESSETLTLLAAGDNLDSDHRTIKDKEACNTGTDGCLVYMTTVKAIEYEVSKNEDEDVENALDGNGNKVTNGTHYGKLGWMAEEFVAVNGNVKKLAKLIIEQETAASEKKTIIIGETWDIGGGWELVAQSIDAKASPRQVWFILSYNGIKLDDRVIGQGEVYTYVEKSIANESDVPLFVTYVDSVFAGATTDMAQLRYTWAISRDITEVKSGDTIGVFELSATADTITGKLDSSIDLTTNSVNDLAGNFKIRVADDSDFLRFYPMVERTEPGTHEIRGAVIDTKNPAGGEIPITTDFQWNAQNFGAFWYDLDERETSETLTLITSGGNWLDSTKRTIEDKDGCMGVPNGCLVYKTEEKYIEYEVSKNKGAGVENALTATGTKVTYGTHYGKLGWLAEEYVAVNGNAKKLAKLIIEQESGASEKKTLYVGETWDIGDGLELVAQSIETNTSPRQVWLVLSYNGVKLDDKVIGQGEVYTYVEKSIAGESDVPMFVTYVDSVFDGATTDMVQLKYTWAISRDITEVKSGDIIGVFELSASSNMITGNLAYSMDLIVDSVIDIAEKLKFRVTDDSDYLRFYPIIERAIGEVTEEEVPISDPDGPYTGTEGVPLTFNGSGSYDPDGIIVSYEWEFGDGDTGTGMNPSHTYAQNGTYTVTLTVTDNDGATDTITTTVTIEEIVYFYDISFLPPNTKSNIFNDRRTLPIKFTARDNVTGKFINDDRVNVTITDSSGYSIAQFTSGKGNDNIRIDTTEELYIVNFNTKDYSFNVGEIYTITVIFGDTANPIGYGITYFELVGRK